MTGPAALVDVAGVLARIREYRFLSSAEAELQALIARALTQEGIAFEREVDLGAAGRIDFLLPSCGAGLEVKVQGSPTEVLRQLQRYAGVPAIAQLVLATTRARLRSMPPTLNGKPLHVLPLTGGLL